MAGANGFLSSDDELAAEAVATEPMNHQIQSELSDSDAPDPIALDGITPTDHHAPRPLAPPPRPRNKMPGAPMSILSGLEPPPITNAHADEDIDVEDAHTKPASAVPIQVVLSWIPPDERAEYEHIKVGEYVPDDEDGKGRKRSYRVSHGDSGLRMLQFIWLYIWAWEGGRRGISSLCMARPESQGVSGVESRDATNIDIQVFVTENVKVVFTPSECQALVYYLVNVLRGAHVLLLCEVKRLGDKRGRWCMGLVWDSSSSPPVNLF